ncbi:MAG: riboflavin biosynthesis protein RibF [Rhizobiales bacterium 65-9]|nr:bifunctional riboflavin kinase/FAD synthetase [Hyphomicrobiales bacterium]OJY38158.1 MAG: riboflavin biosynthesis protein RibF [Rhizobiales bacterium 65-9]
MPVAPSSFTILTDPPSLPPQLARPVLAIGNFDGIHRGHAVLMAAARTLAARLGAPAAVLTFHPHARVVARPDVPHFALCSRIDKARLIARAGMDGLIEISFDKALMALSADAFVDDLLLQRFGARGVVIGGNFRFGRGRAGDPDFLRVKGRARGFEVVVREPVTLDGRVISSTEAREDLQKGDVATAAALLGYWWFVRGVVAHGDKRGRELGFPTANMILDPSCQLAHGIYAVRANVDGRIVDGVASFGRRPTFDDGAPRLETFLFDFSGDLYGKEILVEFIAFLRGEEKFDSIDALVAQMNRDADNARAAIRAAAASDVRSVIAD